MGWWPFGKKTRSPARADEAIAAFWAWWAEVRDDVARAVHGGGIERFVPEMQKRVREIDPELAWAFGPGLAAKHHLCLSAEGRGAGRIVTQRWLVQAPPADEVWEYHPARPPAPVDESTTLRLTGGELRLSEVQLGLTADDLRRRVDVEVYHPLFRDLRPDERSLAAKLILGTMLGEDEVERWVGPVEASRMPPETKLGVDALRAEIEGLRAKADQPAYAVFKADTNEGPIVAAVDLGVRRLDHLHFDHHYEITIVLEGPLENGLPDKPEQQRIAELENELDEALGADAVFLGRETAFGEKLIHYHASASGPVGARLEAWVRSRPQRIIETKVRHDPEWDALSHW